MIYTKTKKKEVSISSTMLPLCVYVCGICMHAYLPVCACRLEDDTRDTFFY